MLRTIAFIPYLFFLLSACGGPRFHLSERATHQITLIGGHFFGPGPILPDTPLPTGYLRDIKFDTEQFRGYAEFDNTGDPDSILSDGKTLINQNIEAGRLDIGGGSNSVLLAAVNGGANRGREYYRLDDQFRFVWTVDLALDPGFAEGIVRVDNFELTTGVVKISPSAQSENAMPGGYDQAGTLKSGQYLVGRVGDYDQDGFMDGVVVAAPRVPLESNMLPGAPVGNQRGFKTDIELPPHLACELTLRSIMNFKPPAEELLNTGGIDDLVRLLKEIRARIATAQINMDRAILGGPWSPIAIKQQGFLISDRLETAKTLNFIALSLTEYYPVYGGRPSDSTVDAIGKMFSQMESLIEKVALANKQTGSTLPNVKANI